MGGQGEAGSQSPAGQATLALVATGKAFRKLQRMFQAVFSPEGDSYSSLSHDS